jgi:hypothetical protein
MIDTIEAQDAWWPPTFSPLGLGRIRLAWWIIAVESHNTRAAMVSSGSAALTVGPPEPGWWYDSIIGDRYAQYRFPGLSRMPNIADAGRVSLGKARCLSPLPANVSAMSFRARWLAAPAAAVAAVAIGPMGVAAAAFDVYAYDLCTGTTFPTPERDFNAVVTTCCVDSGGVPAETNYGLGCVAPVPENAPADFRPTIVMPQIPTAPDGSAGDALIDELIPLPPDAVPTG